MTLTVRLDQLLARLKAEQLRVAALKSKGVLIFQKKGPKR